MAFIPGGMRLLLAFLIVLPALLLTLGCARERGTEFVPGNVSASASSEPAAFPANESSAINANATAALASCAYNSDCPEWRFCIDGRCGRVEDLYATNCTATCRFQELIISTSDGESYTLRPGQGSYTAAGALEWRVYSIPEHCPQENIVIPITLIMKNYGDIVAEKIITLAEGMTSEQMSHPQIPGINFTVRLERVGEECS